MVFYLNFARNLPAPCFRKETAVLTHQAFFFLPYTTYFGSPFWRCILVQPHVPLAFVESVGREQLTAWDSMHVSVPKFPLKSSGYQPQAISMTQINEAFQSEHLSCHQSNLALFSFSHGFGTAMCEYLPMGLNTHCPSPEQDWQAASNPNATLKPQAGSLYHQWKSCYGMDLVNDSEMLDGL